GMVVPISILFGIVIKKAKRLAQQEDVVRLAGEKSPAWAHPMHLCVSLEVTRTVFLGTQSDRVKENVATHATFQEFLHFNQMMGYHRTDVFATREHELDNHAPVFDQVSVEVNLLVVLGDQFDIGQVPLLNKLARRNVLEVV